MKNNSNMFIGKNFGNLYVIERACIPSHVTSKSVTYYNCRCICGNIKAIRVDEITKPYKSCGCIKKPRAKESIPRKPVIKIKTVPASLKRLRKTWHGMKARCYNESHDQYHNYGAKGLTLSDEWLDFDNFKKDMYHSYLRFEDFNGINSATIDRLDNNEGYSLVNCRWVTKLDQARNRSNNVKIEIEGVKYKTLSEVSETFNINYGTLHARYSKGLRDLELVNI